MTVSEASYQHDRGEKLTAMRATQTWTTPFNLSALSATGYSANAERAAVASPDSGLNPNLTLQRTASPPAELAR